MFFKNSRMFGFKYVCSRRIREDYIFKINIQKTRYSLLNNTFDSFRSHMSGGDYD